MKKQFVIGAAILSLMTGCMVGPKYNRPSVKPPDVFRGGADRTPPTDPASLADLKWFEVFKDERLQELVRTALVENYDLRDAVARVDAARANLGITRSDQFPTIAAGADMTTQGSSRNGSFPLPAGVVEQRKVREVRAQRELLVTTLRDRSRLAYLRYRGGVDSLLNALDADRDLFAAELSLAQTTRDELLAMVQLYKALGGGWRQ